MASIEKTLLKRCQKRDPSTRTRSCPTSADDDVVDTRLTGQEDKRKEYLKEDPSTRTWSRPELLEVSKGVEAVWANLRKKERV